MNHNSDLGTGNSFLSRYVCSRCNRVFERLRLGFTLVFTQRRNKVQTKGAKVDNTPPFAPSSFTSYAPLREQPDTRPAVWICGGIEPRYSWLPSPARNQHINAGYKHFVLTNSSSLTYSPTSKSRPRHS